MLTDFVARAVMVLLGVPRLLGCVLLVETPTDDDRLVEVFIADRRLRCVCSEAEFLTRTTPEERQAYIDTCVSLLR